LLSGSKEVGLAGRQADRQAGKEGGREGERETVCEY